MDLDILLRYIYWISSVGVVLAVVMSKKIISFTTIFGIGTILYGLPLYFGYVIYITSFQLSMVNYDTIAWPVYLMFILCQIFFFVSILLKDQEISASKNRNALFFYSMILTLIIYIAFFIITTGDKLLVTEKVERLQYYTIWYYLSMILSVCVIIYYALYPEKKIKKYLIIPIFVFISDLLLGSRSNTFLGILSVSVVFFSKYKEPLRFENKIIVILLGLFLTFLLFIYKPIYYAVVGGVFDAGNLFEYIELAFIGVEPYIVMGTLNDVVKNDIDLPEYYFLTSIIQYIPFYEHIFEIPRVSFNDIFQPIFYPETPWGVASSALGELYAVGHFAAVLIFLGMIFVFLKLNPPQYILWQLLYYFIGPYITIYFYRNDWHMFIGKIRLFFIALLGVFIVYYILKIISRTSIYRKVE